MSDTNAEVARLAALSDEQWVGLQVPRFMEVRPRYVEYAEFLKAVMQHGSARLAPLALIGVRAKSVPSFAEKILRKRKSYLDPRGTSSLDPLLRMTDLCGGRLIAQTSEQVQALCRFIEEAFDIDAANSEDVSRRLRPTEFGYRSVHYIVTASPEKLLAAGFTAPVPPEIRGLKAEIQVRTLLEHAWADIGHEMTYKTEIKVPSRIHHQFAALSAVLEQVDHQFGALVSGLEEFKSNFGAYYPRREVEAEIARLRIVLAYDADNLDLAAKIAQLAISIGRHEMALEIIQPYLDRSHQGVERVRGVALTELHWDHPRSKEYVDGRRSLEAACLTHRTKDAETFCALAESWARDDESKARGLFRQAVAVDSTEPVTLSRYFEFEIAHLCNNLVVDLGAPMIRNAVARCHKQIEARVNLPWAWSSLALLRLLVGEPFEALMAIAQLIRLGEPWQGAAVPQRKADQETTAAGTLRVPSAGPGDSAADRGSAAALAPLPSSPSGAQLSAASRALLRTREALKRIHVIREKLPGYDWCRRAVLIGLAAGLNDPEAVDELRGAASRDEIEEWKAGGFFSSVWPSSPAPLPKEEGSPEGGAPASSFILLLSGACAPEVQDAVEAFKPLLMRACEGLSLTLIAGGTTVGISGVAGDLAEQSAGRIRAAGYLPRYLPRGVKEDLNPNRFAKLLNSDGSDFTPLEDLQAWTDLLAAGVDPRRVKLLNYGGGPISRVQCALGLALGVRVGVVDDAALPKDRQFLDPEWQDCPNLVRLPLDSMTLRAFLLVDELPWQREEFAAAAQRTHEEYLKTAAPRDPSLAPWSALPEQLKVSNFHHVAYAENILKTVGLAIRPLTEADVPLLDMAEALGAEGMNRLAEMEHGRWNVERLLLGWRYAETKDINRKLSPYLVPWNRLPREIQKYDIEAIRSLPASFREAGLGVYRLGRD
jgi:ppGpp synthetase/RelA/SpoT-type nucleotidyltranferase